MGITHIVLTGGPCAGKSTGLAVIEQKLMGLGYKVIILDEMATNVIKSGITPADIGMIPFQEFLVHLQLDRDKHYINNIKTDKKVIILYDRGILDGAAYCGNKEFADILNKLGTGTREVMGKYDGVFHLVTAAKGAEQFYTKENNSARRETAEEAREKDAQTLDAWLGHPHLRVINNKGRNFEQKMNKLLQEILGLLGEPTPLEIERKFLIKKPNIEELQKHIELNRSEIVQTYLTSQDKNIERRIRQRGLEGDYSYYYTEKKVVEGESGTREERERRISEREYLTLLMEADTSKHQIRKDRYCFVYKDRYFELDIYPFWNNKAILEIEVQDITENIDIPNFIEVIEEVTDNKHYKNSSLAENYGDIS